MRPEEALAAARARAAAARERGEYAEDLTGFAVQPTDRVTTAQLLEWAVIEPDLTRLRSTRRWGGPITWAKRLVHRALRQYLDELASQQTRFNLQVVAKLAELEDRREP